MLAEARGHSEEQRREREAADAAFRAEQKRLQEARTQAQAQEAQLDELHTVSPLRGASEASCCMYLLC